MMMNEERILHLVFKRSGVRMSAGTEFFHQDTASKYTIIASFRINYLYHSMSYNLRY